MRNLKAVLGILTLGIVVALVLTTVSVTSNNGSPSSQPVAANVVAAAPTTKAVPTPTATSVPATTVASTATRVPATTVASSPTSLSLPTPTLSPDQVAVGQVIPKIYNRSGTDVKVVKAADAPVISQDEAFQILVKQIGGIPFGYGKPGNIVKLDATYGLVTVGNPGPYGWEGDRNLHLSNGEVLDHIENRLMWVLDFVGVENSPADLACTQNCKINHFIYLIDVKSKKVTIGKTISYKP